MPKRKLWSKSFMTLGEVEQHFDPRSSAVNLFTAVTDNLD
jgi:hypothetical protein